MIVKRELGSQLSQCTEMGLTVFADLSLGLTGSARLCKYGEQCYLKFERESRQPVHRVESQGVYKAVP